MLKNIKKICLLLVFLLVFTTIFVFFLQNPQVINFSYIFGKKEVSLAFLLLIFFSFGALFGILALLPGLIRLKRQVVRLKQQLEVQLKE